jgi:uncharacterized membrane protein YccC
MVAARHHADCRHMSARVKKRSSLSFLDLAFRPDLTTIDWWYALRATCGVALAVVLALHYGSPVDALAAGIGAVGTAPAWRGPYRVQVLATLAAALGMSSAAYIAGIAGHWTFAIVVVTTGSAYIYGVLSSVSEAAGAVGLQALLATIILGDIGTPMAHVGSVALCVLGGGLLQTLLLVIVWGIERNLGKETTPALRISPPVLFGRHPIRVALAIAVAMLIFRLGHIDRGYWIALTAAIVLRPDYAATLVMGVARVAGTIVGGLFAWGVGLLIPAVPAAHAAAAIAFAAVGFVVFRVGPAFVATAITGFVIFLLSMIGLSEATAVLARIDATLIGGALTLIAFAFAQRRHHSSS